MLAKLCGDSARVLEGGPRRAASGDIVVGMVVVATVPPSRSGRRACGAPGQTAGSRRRTTPAGGRTARRATHLLRAGGDPVGTDSALVAPPARTAAGRGSPCGGGGDPVCTANRLWMEKPARIMAFLGVGACPISALVSCGDLGSYLGGAHTPTTPPSGRLTTVVLCVS
jgi:hypothetical protein